MPEDRLPAVRTHGLTALRPGLDPEVRAFVEQLRTVFELLRISVRRYAGLCHRDPGAVSRYLSGERLPKRAFIDELLSELAATKGVPATDEVRAHLYDLYFKALRARDAGAYQVEVVRDQLRDATVTLRQTMRHVKSLEHTLDARQREVEELSRRLREMEESWAADRLRSEEELARHRREYEAVREERERLHRQVTELLEQLQWAQSRQARAEERCQDLEDMLQTTEWSADPLPELSASRSERVWQNVPRRNGSFVGRLDILDMLGSRHGVTVLSGPSGIGKSAIALEYAYRWAERFDPVCWITATGPERIRRSFLALAGSLGFGAGPLVPTVESVLAALESLRGDWLLVFDDVADPGAIAEFLPRSGDGTVIVTTRDASWPDAVMVGPMARTDSLSLIRRCVPPDRDVAEAEADAVAAVLGDLPLIVEQAARWFAATGLTLCDYLRAYQRHDDGDARAAAWRVGLDFLRESEPDVLLLLQLCAVLAPVPISTWLLSGVRDVYLPGELTRVLDDEVRLGRALRTLDGVGLAKVDFQTMRLHLPPGLREVLMDALDLDLFLKLRGCAHRILTNADPRNSLSPVSWERYAELSPHVHETNLYINADEWSRRLVLNEIEFLFQRGDVQRYLEYSELVARNWAADHGANHVLTLKAELQWGRALRIHGQAGPAHERHVSIRDRMLEKFGEPHERTLDAQIFVTSDLRHLGRYEESVALSGASWETARRHFGVDDPIALQHAHHHAHSLRLAGRVKESAAIDAETVRSMGFVLGDDHFHTLRTKINLALDHMDLGAALVARPLLIECLPRMRRLVGDDHWRLFGLLGHLSVAERQRGDHARALELSSVVLAARRRPGHGMLLSSALLNHAVNLRYAGDLIEALAVNKEAVEESTRLFGPRHHATSAAKAGLAVVLRLIGRSYEAQDIDREALEALHDTLGPDHPDSLICAVNVASDAFAMVDLTGACEADHATLTTAERVLGDGHPTTLACALNYALDLRALGRIDAETMFANAVSRFEQQLGESHPLTVQARQGVRQNPAISHPTL